MTDPNGWADPWGLASCNAFVNSNNALNLKSKYADPTHPDYDPIRADEFDAFVGLWDEMARTTPGGFTRQRVHGTPLNRIGNNFRSRARRWLDQHGMTNLAPGHIPDTAWGGAADPGDVWVPLDRDVNQYIGGLTQGVPVGTNYGGVTWF